MLDQPPLAAFDGVVAALESKEWRAVVAGFEGELLCACSGDVRRRPHLAHGGWRGPTAETWTSSLEETDYASGVRRTREHVAAGEVCQANLCRVRAARLPEPATADIAALSTLLAPLGGAARGHLPARVGDWCAQVERAADHQRTGNRAPRPLPRRRRVGRRGSRHRRTSRGIRTFWIDRADPGGPVLRLGTGAGNHLEIGSGP